MNPIHEASDIQNKSGYDALTGLGNKAHAEAAVNELIRSGVKGTLLLIDMDNFKALNDHYGHIAGDKVLKMFADTLRHFSTEEDVICRTGGDEFVVFIKGMTSKEEVSNQASDIIADLCQKIEEYGFDTKHSVSIGIAQMPEDGTEFGKLFIAADKALYYVKQSGKNSYHFFSDKAEVESDRGGRTVDLRYLQDLMSRADSGSGAFMLDFDSFHHVYNFIRRFIERNNRDVRTLLLTVSEKENVKPDPAETEMVLQLLEKAIYTSLRRSDVSTRYSSKQLIVILMDANGDENSDMVAERILSTFRSLYTGGKYNVDYGIARMDSRGSILRKMDLEESNLYD